jgi:hypothetical protein
LTWIDIKDRMPEQDTIALIYTDDNRILVAELYRAKHRYSGRELEYFEIYIKGHRDEFGEDSTQEYMGNFTHWMPLPEPPK